MRVNELVPLTKVRDVLGWPDNTTRFRMQKAGALIKEPTGIYVDIPRLLEASPRIGAMVVARLEAQDNSAAGETCKRCKKKDRPPSLS